MSKHWSAKLRNETEEEIFNDIDKFVKNIINIDSVDKIVKAFSDVELEEVKIIKSGSVITLKHVATGKYLSSCNTNYQTGSKCQVVCIF